MTGRTVSIVRDPSPRRAKRWKVRFRDGNDKRRSKFFATQAEAETYRDARANELRNYGVQALSLPDSVRQEAQRALELLAPHQGASILDAVRYYAAHLDRTNRSLPIEDLIGKYLWDKEALGVSAGHLYDVKKRLERFARVFPKRIIHTFETDEIEDWIFGLRLSPQSKRNYQRVLHAFFGYAVRKKHADTNR